MMVFDHKGGCFLEKEQIYIHEYIKTNKQTNKQEQQNEVNNYHFLKGSMTLVESQEHAAEVC